jgi:protein gp37
MKEEWARDIRDQCQAANVAFFFKQWGGLRPKSGGRELDGREWNGFPRPGKAEAVLPNLIAAE